MSDNQTSDESVFTPDSFFKGMVSDNTEVIKDDVKAEAPVTTNTSDEPPTTKVDDSARPRVNVTDEDRDAFMRHILGSGRFSKTYKLRDGALTVKLKTRTVAENDELYGILADELKSGKITGNVASIEYLLKMYRLFLSASLVSYEIKGEQPVKPDGNTVAERHKWLSSRMHETQFRLLLRCQEEFEYLVAALYRESITQDFTADRAAVF